MLAKQAGREDGQPARCHAVPRELPLRRGEGRAARPQPPAAPGQPPLLSPGPRPPARQRQPAEPRARRGSQGEGGGAAEAAALALPSGGRGVERSPRDGGGRGPPGAAGVGRAAQQSPAASPGGTYREDSPLKLPPSSSRTLQKRMPLTKGTEESSSSSSSTRNLNFFFFIMMKAMGQGPPGGRPHGSSAPLRPPCSAPLPCPGRGRHRGTGRSCGRSQLSPCRPRRSRPALTWQPAPPFQTRPPPLRPLPAAPAGAMGERCRQRLRRGRAGSRRSFPAPAGTRLLGTGSSACRSPRPARGPEH